MGEWIHIKLILKFNNTIIADYSEYIELYYYA